MSEFSILVNQVQRNVMDIDNVGQSVHGVQRMVDNVGDGLSSIGLADVSPTLQSLVARLNKRRTECVSLSDALKRITMKFNTAENNISSFTAPTENDIDVAYDLTHGYELTNAYDAPPVTLENITMDFSGAPVNHEQYIFDISKYDALYHYDENGNLIVDWDKADELLAKDYEDLTPEEICQLANLYMNMPEEDMGEFVSKLMVYDAEYDEWSPDPGKMAAIIHATNYALECDVQASLDGNPRYTDAERRDLMERSSALIALSNFSQPTCINPDTGEAIPPVIEFSRENYPVAQYDRDGNFTGYKEYDALKIGILGPMTSAVGGGLDNDLNYIYGHDNRYLYVIAPEGGPAKGDNLAYYLQESQAVSNYQDWPFDAGVDAAIGFLPTNLPADILNSALDIGFAWGEASNGVATAHNNVDINLYSDMGAQACYVIEGDTYIVNEYNTTELEAYVDQYNESHGTHIKPVDILSDPRSYID